MTQGSLAREVLSGLQGREFTNYGQLEREVVDAFNMNLSRFPGGYSYSDFVRFARRRNLIRATGEGHYVVVLDPTT
jgi:hypothetical protein